MADESTRGLRRGLPYPARFAGWFAAIFIDFRRPKALEYTHAKLPRVCAIPAAILSPTN